MKFNSLSISDEQRDCVRRYVELLKQERDNRPNATIQEIQDIVWEKFFREIREYIKSHTGEGTPSNYAELVHTIHLAEWTFQRQPFYRLFPGVIEALEKFDISRVSTFTDVEPIDSVLIEFPVGYERDFGNNTKITTILFSCGFSEEGEKFVAIHFQTAEGDYALSVNDSAEHLEQYLNGKKIPIIGGENDEPDEYNAMCESTRKTLRLLAGLLFLTKTPELFSPIVLKKDADRYETADAETRKKLVDKAVRNGVIGYEIGKDIPTRAELERFRKENAEALEKGVKSPHIRVGHLHLFWTGKGRSLPMFKYVKTTLVNFGKVFDIPQGYYA